MPDASVVPIICPRCGHQQAGDAADCAGCGVILAKATPFGARAHGRAGAGRGDSANARHVAGGGSDLVDPSIDMGIGDRAGIGRGTGPGNEVADAAAPPATLIERASDLLLRDESADSAALAGRAVVWLGLLVWSWRFASASIASNAAGASWLHLIDLVFHEAGHMLFMPFGQFVMTLGGSLTQLLIPAALMVVFLTRHRDPFGAAVCWWWTGQNLIDLAPYINDARALRLVLLGGRTGAEVEGHDWERILMTLGWLHHDHALARAAHGIGAIIMISACVWAARLLAAHWRRSRTAGAGTPDR